MKTSTTFKQMKEKKEPIAMITAYDAPTAKIVEQAGVDMILVGDSLGMVVLGYDSTVPVTIEDMILHTKAVRRGAKDTFVVTDMPFLTYHSSVSETMSHAQSLMQEGGAHAIKLEGNGEVIKMIDHLTAAGVPVVSHLGLTPQSVGVLGGYRVQGKDADSAKQLIEDAKSAERAGAFALVLECVPKQLAAYISEVLSIPVIGIGAGVKTDGQVLVYHDIIGYGSTFTPKFVKQYTEITPVIHNAVNQYVSEVKSLAFPEDKHSFTMKEEHLQHVYGGVKP
ncbi:3-methyl-2-oxobutanoate hydroxymethyltransferase [Desertibacillus haloalkaliphilus]|uniref:3-methyl-2-oxobutanoate hydroxymethyltransferase n=1 Tax=Desertibacillus haloalkaliphilus TaxID=1328930 RepID=UPI001C254520|nr:3-methyl-2-oxobutanoate hydroxymethyltransferase [Desertibacillus haloalkaliphilus]MBU8907276.1 3-methyl-2-oxobutanoate hydroxymethyltransferase [Desertibacillus haloalkaliphilus]